MTSLLRRCVIPVVPNILRSLTRIDCRLYSNKVGTNNASAQSASSNPDKNESESLSESVISNHHRSLEESEAGSTISISSKHVSFKEEEAPIILDVEEERIVAQQAYIPKDPLEEIFSQISQQRGRSGVFDIHELVEVLKLSRAKDICVVSVPEEARYVDYMLFVTGKSTRHMLAMAEFVRRVYKKKRDRLDPIPKIEGKTCKNWMALDLGNIALHIFSASARKQYDLESLWAVGPEFDPNCIQEEDSIVALLRRHSLVLDNLQPAE